MNCFKHFLGCLILMIVAASTAAESNSAPREQLLMDFGWKFHLGNEWGNAQSLTKAGTGSGPASTSFSDASWRAVNLPHDWAIELPFDAGADGAHGFKALGRGFPSNSVAWYRRTFALPKNDSGKRLGLEFDGVFRDCTVFLNGWFVGHHESGYSSFRFDITDLANCGGTNVLAVKVDASDFEGWFYEGAGIYRHMWLVKTAPLAVVPDGNFVYSQFKNNVPEGPAEIHIQTQLMNSQNASARATVTCEVLDANGRKVSATSKQVQLDVHAQQTIEQISKLSKPALWSPESPQLYKLVTTVESDGAVVDRTEAEFGIRTVGFDAEKGFLLNGKPYVLKGTCNHQDHAGVGAALPDGLQYFRIAKLKEMGGNAYRTSHNPPTPELLEACDHLGMLVMDENRLLGGDATHLDQLERLVRRDRNHASVAIWSIANEEFGVQGTPTGKRVAETMQDLVKRLDSTRPVSYAAPVGNEFAGINEIIEVRGWNYHVGKDMDDYRAAHPKQPNVGTEQGSTVSTRGIYTNDAARGYVSAYDDNAPSWAHTAETWWSYFDERPWLSGGFVWTGFDYRGEPTPYGWPCINSHFGILDTCGFPKDNFWYYQSWWTDKPVLHLLPHWNWQGKEGQEIDVRALSNCEEVELFLNGQSLGKEAMKKNSELKWKVKYTPGALTAKGFKGGKVAAEVKVETTGTPTKVQLDTNRAAINANGEDISIITVSARDAEGRIVPVATNSIHFELDGPGKIVGVGNGDPSCHEPDAYFTTPVLHATSVDGWRWRLVKNVYGENLTETKASFDDSNWQAANVQSESGPMREREQAVFRTRLNVSEDQLASPSVELRFAKLNGDGWLYINGQKVGEAHDRQSAAVFDVKRFLRAGENVIAVAVANWNNVGGINRGVELQVQDKTTPSEWQRNVFNGLGQIIVQSSKTAGEIKLTARADGLQPVTLMIQSQTCSPRPSLP
jgi:beta-galactosidase